MSQKRIIFILFILFSLSATSQVFDKKDKAVFINPEPGFYQNVIMKDVNSGIKFQNRSYLSMDFDENYPVDISKYEIVWHVLPKSQGNAGTCWCFAATSFYESEIFRQTENKVDLSEMYFVYWEYVDRALDFVRTRGKTYFEQGSEANALKRIIPKYGCVPDNVYSGIMDNREYHSHDKMVEEMKNYLNGVKTSGEWNSEIVEHGIRSILDKHMGKVLETFTYSGKKYTPKSFYTSLKVDIDDMFSFMSTLSKPYNQKAELVEADNWWHSNDYYNLSLDDYYSTIFDAVKNGYSICLCGDVSEPGHNSMQEVAIIPDFDIPSEYINASSRELRLNNSSTTDDHCIQIVGYQETEIGTWFLIKDSGSGAFDGANKGYRFFHEDYIRLKMMNVMMNKDAARKVLDKIIKK